MWANKTRVAGASACALLAACATLAAQSGNPALPSEAACQTLVPASVGGPMPRNASVAVIRWLGHSNFEIAYRDTVILADAYIDRVPGSHPIGVLSKDFKKVDAILVGHAHFDHIADAPTIAKQTGAMVVGASMGNDFLKKDGLPDVQIRTVTGTGGEHLEVKGILVEPILGHHNVIATTVPPDYQAKVQTAMTAAALVQPLTEAEQQQTDAIRARGSRDPGIAAAGTIGYLLTLGTDFRIMIADSPGPITDFQRQAMQRVGGVDVGLLSLVSMDAGIPPLVEMVRTFKPKSLFIGHHDGAGTLRWASTFLPAMAIRDAAPAARVLEVPYRTPVCYNTTTKEMFVGL